MEQISYERPREKLQSKCASFLTKMELVQVVLGSGTARVSGARLSRRVTQLINHGDVSFNSLRAVQGIGMAKACQVLAAIELGRRVYLQPSSESVGVDEARIRRHIAKLRPASVIVYFFDGASEELNVVTYSLKREHLAIIIQQLATKALALKARSLIVAIGSRRDSLETTTTELEIIKQLKDSLGLLSLRLEAVYRANSIKVEKWNGL